MTPTTTAVAGALGASALVWHHTVQAVAQSSSALAMSPSEAAQRLRNGQMLATVLIIGGAAVAGRPALIAASIAVVGLATFWHLWITPEA